MGTFSLGAAVIEGKVTGTYAVPKRTLGYMLPQLHTFISNEIKIWGPNVSGMVFEVNSLAAVKTKIPGIARVCQAVEETQQWVPFSMQVTHSFSGFSSWLPPG